MQSFWIVEALNVIVGGAHVWLNEFKSGGDTMIEFAAAERIRLAIELRED